MSAAAPAVAARTLARFRPTPERLVLPDVCCDLIWARGRLFVSGPMTHAAVSRFPGELVTLLRIDASRAGELFRAPLADLTDRVVELCEIDPRLARDLVRRFERDDVVGLVGPANPRSRIATAAAVLSAGASVDAAAASVELTARHLERLFHVQVGLAPKTFARIVRFRRAVVAATLGMPLAAAAAAHGFADQAHLCREVRALSGRSPTALLPHVGSVQDIVAGDL